MTKLDVADYVNFHFSCCALHIAASFFLNHTSDRLKRNNTSSEKKNEDYVNFFFV